MPGSGFDYDEDPWGKLLDSVFMINNKIDNLDFYVRQQLKQMDLKKVKQNRTLRNRCQFVLVKKGTPCKGYVCNKSSTFCYAHHLRAVFHETPLNKPKQPLITDEKILLN